MRIAIFLTSLFLGLIGHSQSLPIDFETTINTSDFVDFDGGIASVLENPQAEGINTSTHVAKIIRSDGAIWAGSKIALTENLDFSTLNSISMKVYTTAPVGTIVKFKLEGATGARNGYLLGGGQKSRKKLANFNVYRNQKKSNYNLFIKPFIIIKSFF
jgi:hypothetical protein|tara:strand:- start:2454 stop:2927 length:474 start_codon:yes stop_codon:yes gene_type:complete